MFHDLKSLLSNAVGRAGLRRQVDAVQALDYFADVARAVLGQAISDQTKPLHVKNGILTVACSSSLIMQELRYHEPEIITALNKKTGNNDIKKLSYVSLPR